MWHRNDKAQVFMWVGESGREAPTFTHSFHSPGFCHLPVGMPMARLEKRSEAKFWKEKSQIQSL